MPSSSKLITTAGAIVAAVTVGPCLVPIGILGLV